MPAGPQGAGSVALHVADGSQIVSERVGGPSLTVDVGGERFGSCLRRLTPARLAGGWLPILETRYRGRSQESFAARVPEVGTLVSFVRVTGRGEIGFTPSVAGLRRRGNRLVRAGRTYATFSAGARWNGRSLVYAAAPAYVAWLDHPAAGAAFVLDAARYAEARSAVAGFWRRQLAEGAQLVVPEPRVMNAERALLVQNLALSWRYSIGNPYEEFSFPESLDGAQVLAELGFVDVARTIVRASLTRRPTPYPSWKQGEKLLAAATVVRLSGDRELLTRLTPTLARLRRLARAEARPRRPARGGALLLGHPRLGAGAARAGGRLAGPVGNRGRVGGVRPAAPGPRGRAGSRSGSRSGLRRAVRASERRLPDGSLFLPMRLTRRRAAVRVGDRVPRGELLEPRRAVRARLRALRPGQRRVDGGAALPAAARLAAARARARRRLRALRPRCAAARLGHRPGVRRQRCRGSSPPRTRPTSSCSASTASSPPG